MTLHDFVSEPWVYINAFFILVDLAMFVYWVLEEEYFYSFLMIVFALGIVFLSYQTAMNYLRAYEIRQIGHAIRVHTTIYLPGA